MYKALKRLKPDIVHTRNLGALDALVPALLAGVKIRIHGEHGWHHNDIHGANKRERLLRQIHSPLVTTYVAVSSQLKEDRVDSGGIGQNLCRIYSIGI